MYLNVNVFMFNYRLLLKNCINLFMCWIIIYVNKDFGFGVIILILVVEENKYIIFGYLFLYILIKVKEVV